MGSCTSCKYCTQIGSDDEGNAVKRRCTHHMKSYEDYVEYDCRYYIYESPYSSSSSSSSSSSASSSDSRKEHKYLKRFVILLIILAFIFVGFSRVLHFIATNHNTSVTTTDSPQIIPDTEDSDIKQPQLSTAPNAESTSTEETISSAVLKACGTATVTPIEGLNLRVGPAISYRRILVMGQYETVTVFYITNNWAYVDYGGTKGWCSCDWLDLSNVTFVEETADRNDTYYVENPDGIELLLGRYNGAPVIVYIGVFSEVILLRIDGDYAYVDYNGYKGWCYLDQLTVTVPESEATVYLNEDATVSGSSEVAIYSSNSTSSSTITQIEEGATVIILIIDGNWAYIDFSGNKGWCQLSYLIRDEEIITEKTTNSTTTENTKNNIENNQNKDEADKLLDEFISNYYASSTVHQNNNNNNDNNGKTALDMEIDIAIIDSQLIKDSYRGKPVNGRTEMTKDEVLDFYLEVDKLCKITENSPPGVLTTNTNLFIITICLCMYASLIMR